jgi:cation transport ATPase
MVVCQEIAGRGVRSTYSVEDRIIHLSIGSQDFISQEHADFDLPSHQQEMVNSWRDLGHTVVFVLKQDSATAVASVPVLFGIADQVRPGFKDAIAHLKASGKTIYMLTGDNTRTALAVARTLGLDGRDYLKANMLPLEKAEFISNLKKQRRVSSRTLLEFYRPTSRPAVVAFVGDGLNDSAALAAADVGIALSHGSDVSIASASFVVISNGSVPHAINQLFKISSKVYRRQIFNFGWAMLYNVALVPVAAGVLYPYRHTQLSPVWSALAMALSSVSVVVSSLALKWNI